MQVGLFTLASCLHPFLLQQRKGWFPLSGIFRGSAIWHNKKSLRRNFFSTSEGLFSLVNNKVPEWKSAFIHNFAEKRRKMEEKVRYNIHYSIIYLSSIMPPLELCFKFYSHDLLQMMERKYPTLYPLSIS